MIKSIVKFSTLLLLLIISRLLLASTEYISLNPYGAWLDESEAFFDHNGIVLPKKGVRGDRPSFELGFTLPSDFPLIYYGKVWIEVTWNTYDTYCGFDLRNSILRMYRINEVPVSGTLRVSDYADPLLTGSRPNEVHKTVFDLSLYSNTTWQRGDAVLFGLFRAHDYPNDTCDRTLMINGVSVHWGEQLR
jgi:hypothetical protein